MANEVNVMLNGQVTPIPLDGANESDVLEAVRSQLVGSQELSPSAKVVERNGYYEFTEPHGTAG